MTVISNQYWDVFIVFAVADNAPIELLHRPRLNLLLYYSDGRAGLVYHKGLTT